MPCDPDKKCLDNRIVVDTSNGRLHGWDIFVAWSCAGSTISPCTERSFMWRAY
jgi:hypothetical protein